MSKIKYSIPTSIGLVTRTSERDYAFVVVAEGMPEQLTREQRQWEKNSLIKSIAYDEEMIATSFDALRAKFPNLYEGQKGKDRLATDIAKAHDSVARNKASLSDFDAETEVEVEKNKLSSAVLGFCGRLDLAQKLVARCTGGWLKIEIVPILSEHKK
jgi:hypothetical protein